MNKFHRVCQYLGPILAMLLGLITKSNFDGIQSGVYSAEPASYALTGGTGLASLISLIVGLYSSYRTTGVVPVQAIVEIGALQVLGGALAADGDTKGLELLSPLTAHVVARKLNHDNSPVEGKS